MHDVRHPNTLIRFRPAGHVSPWIHVAPASVEGERERGADAEGDGHPPLAIFAGRPSSAGDVFARRTRAFATCSSSFINSPPAPHPPSRTSYPFSTGYS
ncbi:hypothetical protein FIBSPDRAFT_855100, partial [Athelia psychrophila]